MLEKIVKFYANDDNTMYSLTKKAVNGSCPNCAFHLRMSPCDIQDGSAINCHSFYDGYVWEKYDDFLKNISNNPCSTRLINTIRDQARFTGINMDECVVDECPQLDEAQESPVVTKNIALDIETDGFIEYVNDILTKEPKQMILSTDSVDRKNTPITSGVLDYFPLAIVEVSKCSKAGNDQHNPGQPLHWDKTKSTDHADCIGRHLIDRGSFDTDGVRHSAKLAWRALALLQIELENEKDIK